MSDDFIDFWLGFSCCLFVLMFVKLVVRVYDLEDEVKRQKLAINSLVEKEEIHAERAGKEARKAGHEKGLEG